jgi:hypothetical protein
MHIAYLIVTLLLVVMLIYSAMAMYLRAGWILSSMSRAGVPESWLPTLATLKAAGAIGLLLGLAIPAIGLAAAVGVTLFFVGAIVTHIRARWGLYAPMPFFVMAVGALALRALSL